MPYLQLDVPWSYPIEVKHTLARRLGEIYSRMMQADVRRISVAIRELGEGGLWRCTGKAPYPAALLMCDIRRGRTAEQRAAVAKALVAACMDSLELKINEINVEFTQHAGDEMYHPLLGGLSDGWSENEASG
ncbi:tautomerase family protein [Schlesneria paludicola]|uniref:tautomerase n=1 Tax=Schlesneria paludicola TaxID=360056 RepID=UPI00029A53FB|nr:tautomerase [Schlesneria paludicola]